MYCVNMNEYYVLIFQMFYPHFESQIALCRVLGIKEESINFPVPFLFFSFFFSYNVY